VFATQIKDVALQCAHEIASLKRQQYGHMEENKCVGLRTKKAKFTGFSKILGRRQAFKQNACKIFKPLSRKKILQGRGVI